MQRKNKCVSINSVTLRLIQKLHDILATKYNDKYLVISSIDALILQTLTGSTDHWRLVLGVSFSEEWGRHPCRLPLGLPLVPHPLV